MRWVQLCSFWTVFGIICISVIIDFLLPILIPACVSSRPVFPMVYSAYKLNKQDDNIQPWHTSFPIWNQSIVPCLVLTVASWPAYRFLRRQVRSSGILISWRIFQFVVIYTVKDFGVINNRLDPNRKMSMSRLYIVTPLILITCIKHHEKRWAGRNISWNQDCWEKSQ